ncbi:unnamed protein product [Effrenium voratum]|nr:unnamed protein product [Effrenium voratum]
MEALWKCHFKAGPELDRLSARVLTFLSDVELRRGSGNAQSLRLAWFDLCLACCSVSEKLAIANRFDKVLEDSSNSDSTPDDPEPDVLEESANPLTRCRGSRFESLGQAIGQMHGRAPQECKWTQMEPWHDAFVHYHSHPPRVSEYFGVHNGPPLSTSEANAKQSLKGIVICCWRARCCLGTAAQFRGLGLFSYYMLQPSFCYCNSRSICQHHLRPFNARHLSSSRAPDPANTVAPRPYTDLRTTREFSPLVCTHGQPLPSFNV